MKSGGPITVTDQMNRTIRLEHTPRRIVSLVPSQTELLYDLGLNEEVVGITKFCVHPESWYRQKPRVGGTKTLDFEKIKARAPDLIIGNREENEQAQIEKLMALYPVWMSDIKTLPEALGMIGQVGALCGKAAKAAEITTGIREAFAGLPPAQPPPRRTAYFIWSNPWMAAGNDTFIHEMLNICGLQNVFNEPRYPEISAERLKQAAPELILLSSEPFPFKDKHRDEFRKICPTAEVCLVDGELFSWYGSRLLKAPAYFNKHLRSA